MRGSNTRNPLQHRVLEKLSDNSMTVFFAVLAVLMTYFSKQSLTVSLNDFIVRFFRNYLLVVSLILPISAGIGLNFGIVLGALGSQIAMIIALAVGSYGRPVPFYLFWGFLTIVICILFGYLLARLFNATKGQEMISGLFVGFLAVAFYMIILMVILGGIIKISDSTLVSAPGEPIKMTITLPSTVYQGLDKMLVLPFTDLIIFLYAAVLCASALRARKAAKRGDKAELRRRVFAALLATAAFLFIMLFHPCYKMFHSFKLPVVTAILSALVALLTWWLMKTKLGHDFLVIRNDMHIAAAVGIDVDRTRMTAIILSTVFAGLGQLVYIQNLGTMITYGMQNTVSTFAIAAILIGGATVTHASIKDSIVGTILFHCIYSTAPNAAKNLFGNTQIGEYFRMFLCYGVIAVAVVMYAVREVRAAREKLKVTE